MVVSNESRIMKENRSGCPVEEVMIQLGGRWKMMILSYLLEQPRRFNEIKKSIPNISQRMLVLELKSLEDQGFISRKVIDEKPVKVEYSITDDGKYLEPLIINLRIYGQWIRDRNAELL